MDEIFSKKFLLGLMIVLNISVLLMIILDFMSDGISWFNISQSVLLTAANVLFIRMIAK